MGAAAKCARFDAAVTSAALELPARCDAAGRLNEARKDPRLPPLLAASLGSVPADRRQASADGLRAGQRTTRSRFRGPNVVAGCSSRETILSIEPVVAAPTWRALPLFLACGSPEAGGQSYSVRCSL